MLKRTNIYLENQEIAYYKTTAKRCGVSMSEAIRKDLRKQRLLGNACGGNWAQSLLRMAENAVPDREGKTDVSRRHDYYLQEDEIKSWKSK